MFGVAMEGKPSPRREVQLQGPRPTPLKVRKESHKIRKPPPGPSHAPPPAAPPPRQPIIIYTVSPKVIHATPGDFMTLVQRLTGPSPTAASAAAAAAAEDQPSPAARLAAYEKALVFPTSSSAARIGDEVVDYNIINQLELPVSSLDRSVYGSGILSPMPTSLPLISPSFFSPAVNPNTLSFLHDLSPIFHGNRSYIDNTFFSSPSAFISNTPIITSPTAFDLFFNQFP